MNLKTAESQIQSLPKHDRVRLRRGRRSAGLWRIMVEQGLDPESHQYEEERYELLLQAIALLGQGSMDYGRALYETNYSQLRLERLLEAEDIFDEARKTVRFLHAQAESASWNPDWSQLNDYLKYQNEQARRAIARSFFTAKYNDNQ